MNFAPLMVLAGGVAVQAQKSASPSPNQPVWMLESSAFLKGYCSTCHNQKLKTGGLALDTIDLKDVSGNGELLEKIVLKVGSGAMPPASARRPDKPSANAFLASLETSLDRASAAHPNPGRPMMPHRLNRTGGVPEFHPRLARGPAESRRFVAASAG
jgi:hypothetical protein